MGSRGMPRRYASYDPEFLAFHQLSTIGAFYWEWKFCSRFWFYCILHSKGPRCSSNPFKAASLEWQSSPPISFTAKTLLKLEPYLVRLFASPFQDCQNRVVVRDNRLIDNNCFDDLPWIFFAQQHVINSRLGGDCVDPGFVEQDLHWFAAWSRIQIASHDDWQIITISMFSRRIISAISSRESQPSSSIVSCLPPW